jgi:hypothetical protein
MSFFVEFTNGWREGCGFRQLRTSRRIRLGSCVPFPEVGAAPFDCARMAVGNGVATQAQCHESTQARSMARFASFANSVHGHAPSRRVTRAEALRDYAFKPHLAGVAENHVILRDARQPRPPSASYCRFIGNSLFGCGHL